MQLEHEFVVPVPVAQAWQVLLDVERIAPCMPGATVKSFDGETIEGQVKVKVGPIQVTYAGTARFTDKDETARRVVIDANAKESRGAGTAQATIEARLLDQGSATKVTVTTDLAITGKPAQFGRGVMVEVGNKLLGKFADCLSDEIQGGQLAASVADATATGNGAAPSAAMGEAQARPGPVRTPLRPVPETEPIDLLDTAGMPVLKRLAPVLVGLVVLVVLWKAMRRR